MIPPTRPHGLVIDNFAGGGGASLGIERALGRIDIAINHDPEAIAMHRANHPGTRHFDRDIWQIDPLEATGGRRVALAWFSPDCCHFSKAKGSRPLKQNIRDLAWVVLLWARRAQPALICLENVEEFQGWGPLDERGLPDKARAGETFRQWVDELRQLGYDVDWRELRACDYGTPTVRKRLFVVARCDGHPIVWPAPSHGDGLLPYRTAAECIDWSLPCPSIFLSREQGRAIGVKRPLANATMRRIARGTVRYVIDAADPFIVPLTHAGDRRVHPLSQPFRTLTAAHRGEHALVSPCFIQCHGERAGQAPRCHPVNRPARIITPTANSHMLVSAFLAQHNTGMTGHDARTPLSTIVQRGSNQNLVTAFLSRHFGGSTGQSPRRPAPTVTAGGGGKTAIVAAALSHQYSSNTNGGDGRLTRPHKTVTTGGHHGLIAAFLTKYYGDGGQWQTPADPMHTVPTRGRLGLVTVIVDGHTYILDDIGMRMLTPRELFRAQGFPDRYIIDPIFKGKPLTKTAQIRMCGNSVCPQVAEAIIAANIGSNAMRRAA